MIRVTIYNQYSDNQKQGRCKEVYPDGLHMAIKNYLDKNPDLENLLFDPFFSQVIKDAEDSWRRIVCTAVQNGIPVPAFSSALAYFDGYRSERLPANLLQAQRDYFGAHTYERTDKPRGKYFHTNWTGQGGTTSASTYVV